MAGPSSPGVVAPTIPPDVDVGAELGSWKLVALLGHGAMGRVYRARHVRLGREAAVKVLNAEYVARPDVVQRFFREARVVNDIDHEHIVEVTDFVEAPGLAYLVMELLEGKSLRELMKQRGRKYPTVRRILAMVAQICDALQAAHDKGVVHRDLKPDNVFVVSRDGGDFVKVLDFGVAKLHDTVDHARTSSGVILGTPHYMSPEQALGKEVDRYADIWAAGVVLYELLAGAVPFTAASFVELAVKIRDQAPPPLPPKTPRRERIPAAVAAIVTRCLEKKPSERYRSMAALAEALRAPGRRPPKAQLQRALVAAGATAAVAAGVVGAMALDVPRHARTELEAAWRTARGLVRDSTARAPASPAGPTGAAPALAPTPPEDSAQAAAPERDANDASEAHDGSDAPATHREPAPHHDPASHRAPAAHAAEHANAAKRAQETGARSREAARPAQRARTVELLLRSTPPGASVVRLDTGERLGRTPLRVNVARKDARVWLRMALEGRGEVRFAVDLRKDNTANVEFKKPKKTARKR